VTNPPARTATASVGKPFKVSIILLLPFGISDSMQTKACIPSGGTSGSSDKTGAKLDSA
jgi:hypothetical protein